MESIRPDYPEAIYERQQMKSIIMAGGAGKRLYPLSTEEKPKQFIDFFHIGGSLFKETYKRALMISSPDDIYVVTNAGYIDEVRKEILSLGTVPDEKNLIGEPCPKNTLPAILAGVMLPESPEDEIYIVFPADHHITDPKTLIRHIRESENIAKGAIVTFGMKAKYPETGYGYIEPGNPLGNGFRVTSFREKPDWDTAKGYISKGYLWNSGIFMFNRRIFLDECKRHANDIYKAFLKKGNIEEIFEGIDKGISIDRGIMEKSSKRAVVPMDAGWSDLGGFHALYDLFPFEKKVTGNITRKHHVSDEMDLIYMDNGNIYLKKESNFVLLGSKENKKPVFGTGGIREKMGDRPGQMNEALVEKAAKGFSDYLLDKHKGKGKPSVAVTYDSRMNSHDYAILTARTMTGKGLDVYIFDDIRPVPELSYAIRKLGCSGGVAITASHNPPEYNGFKVYGNDGVQLLPYETSVISDYIERNEDKIKGKGDYNLIGSEVDEKYIDEILKRLEEFDKNSEHDVRIAYTPLFGAGINVLPMALKKAGFTDIHMVESQSIPDGRFPGLFAPNPEYRQSYDLAVKTAIEADADIVIATDPDCDRMGAAVKNADGEYELLSGNRTGAVLLRFILDSGYDVSGTVIVKSIVTTGLLDEMACDGGIGVETVPTGFKYICSRIKSLKKEGKRFLMGAEESGGFLFSDYAGDKDAVAASLMISAAAAFYKAKGLTLIDVLNHIYESFGYYRDFLECFDIENGGDYDANAFKAAFPEAAVDKVDDIRSGDQVHPCDMTRIMMKDGSWIAVRKSGTEPILKVYYDMHGNNMKDAEDKLIEARRGMRKVIKGKAE